MLFYPLYEVAKRCDCKIKLFHDPTVFEITVINNTNQYLKHKDNNLQIPIALLNLILMMKIEQEMMKSAVYANYAPHPKEIRESPCLIFTK
jgi:hypothetical protein